MKRIRKLLVANRGEIAIRVMRAAAEIDVTSVAIYSREDRFSLHRFKVDESYLVGDDCTPVQAYLEIDDIVRAARNCPTLCIAVARSGAEIDLFDDLSATLGKPDYAQVTRENLQPSALFQKLFDDAARSVCAAWIARDLEAPVEPRLLPPDDADPDAHLRGLVHRFHQRTVPPGGPDEARWRWRSPRCRARRC